MTRFRRILLTGGGVLLAALFTLALPPSMLTVGLLALADDEEISLPTDDIRITRTNGDVTMTVQGPTEYLVKDIRGMQRTSPWYCDIAIFARGDIHHEVTTSVGPVQRVTLRNATCKISKRSAKQFTGLTYGRLFTLVEGPDATPGENLYVKGTFTAQHKDGAELSFHEEGTGRVWKTVPSSKKKKK